MKHLKEEYEGVSIELNTSIGRQKIDLISVTEEQLELLHSYGIDTSHFFVEIPRRETTIHYEAIDKPKPKTDGNRKTKKR